MAKPHDILGLDDIRGASWSVLGRGTHHGYRTVYTDASAHQLRAFAALAAVGYHADKLAAEHWAFLPAHAVGVFFILSGFVLQSAYGGDLRGLNPVAFVGKRFARIWPLHAAIAILMVITLPGWTHVTDHALRALTLTQAWSSHPEVFFWQGNGASWSLSAELAFYASFPVLTGLVRRRPALIAAAAITMVITYILLVGDTGTALGNFSSYYVNPMARLPEFVLGMVAAELLPYLSRLRLPRGAWTAAEVGAVLGAAGGQCGLQEQPAVGHSACRGRCSRMGRRRGQRAHGCGPHHHVGARPWCGQQGHGMEAAGGRGGGELRDVSCSPSGAS